MNAEKYGIDPAKYKREEAMSYPDKAEVMRAVDAIAEYNSARGWNVVLARDTRAALEAKLDQLYAALAERDAEIAATRGKSTSEVASYYDLWVRSQAALAEAQFALGVAERDKFDLKAALAEAQKLTADIQHKLHPAKTWNGQGWTYNPLAGHIVKQIDTAITASKGEG